MLDLLLDFQRSALTETFRAWERTINAMRLPQIAADVQVAHTPHDVLYEEDTLQLLRFRSDSIDVAEPILICYALVNRPYILDLQADRSVVRQLIKRGFDVYLIDWGVPTAADRSLTLADYIDGFLKKVVTIVCNHSGSRQLNLLGYCMGGTMSTIYTAMHQEHVRNLILMAAPIDFSGTEGLLNLWSREELFDVDSLVDAYGNCPGSFLQSCFQLRDPVQNYFVKYMNFYEKMYDSEFLKNFFVMERWTNDNIPVAGETFRQFVKKFYQQNELVRGQFRLLGNPVRLDQITCPILMLVADRDDLVPASSTLALRNHVRSEDIESMSIDAGHIGLAVSSRAHRHLWPEAAMWIADRSTTRR